MGQLKKVLAAFGLCIFAAARLASADAKTIRIIVHPSVVATTATSAEIKAVFLETSNQLKDGSRVQPVVLKGAAFETFARNYVGKTSLGLETYYRSLVFSGTGVIPKMFGSDDQVIAYVAKTPGAIGYVSGAVANSGVRILEVK